MLTNEQIDIAWRSVDYTMPYDKFCVAIARAIETEVRKQDTELILQLVERLERADKISGYPNNQEAIKAGRARLAA